MPAKGFDYRRRRPWLAWGAEREWPPINPIPADPNTYVYISSEHTTDPPVSGETNVQLPAPLILTNIGYYGLNNAYPSETGFAAPGSATWPAANQARYYPFQVVESFSVVSLATYNGATASGNVDVGIYSSSGTLLVSSGSTAQSGTSTLQTFSLTTTLARGKYFMATACDNTTATFFRNNIGDSTRCEMAGIYMQSSAFPLPSTATFAAPTTAYCNIMAVSRRSSPL